MPTLTEFLKTISEELGDQPDGGGPLSWQRWSPNLLAAYFNEGYCLLASLQPNAFTAIRDVKLNAGSAQQLGDCCPVVLAVTEQVDANGNTMGRLDLQGSKAASSKVDWATTWGSGSCSSGVAFRLKSARKDASAQNVFYVSPAVPTGETVYVRAVCGGVNPAAVGLSADVAPCKFLAALRSYVLSAAMSSQLESSQMQSGGRDHYQRFLSLAKYGIEREDAVRKVANA